MSRGSGVSADVDVVIVGAGPTGLLLAAELTRLGVSVTLLESRAIYVPGTRAIGVHSPVLTALEASGATDRILSEATRVHVGLARSRERMLGEVHFNRLKSPFPFVATVPQSVTETAVAQGGPPPLRGIRVVSVTEASDRVVVNTESDAGASEFYARVVVIAAGAAGRDLIADRVRLSSHVYPDRYLMVDVVHAPSQPDDAAVIHLDQDGVLESFPLPGGGRRLVAWDSNTGKSILNSHTDTERLQRAVAQRTGDEALAAQVTSASSFGIRRALLHRLRIGRVIAIGDTAHEVSPIGGQGMNLGLLDAVTLATPLSHWLRDEQASRELDRWEQRRLKSARTAVRLASLNTALGRSRSRGSSRASSLTVGVLLRSPLSQLATRAYAMGFDADA